MELSLPKKLEHTRETLPFTNCRTKKILHIMPRYYAGGGANRGSFYHEKVETPLPPKLTHWLNFPHPGGGADIQEVNRVCQSI